MTTETDRLADAIKNAAREIAEYIRNVCLVSQGMDGGSDFYIPHIAAILAGHFPSAPSDRYVEGLEAAANCVDDFDNEYNRKNHAQFADDMRQLAVEIRALKGPTHV